MTKIDLANQTKGMLPQANVEGLTAFMTDLNSTANMLGYADFKTMIGVLTLQIEANRETSGASPIIGYIDPTP
jgi:hypothetical protein